MNVVLWLVIAAGLLAVLYGVLQTMVLLRSSAGNAKMQEISAAVREGVAAWRAAGVSTPILVPSSASGNQLKAVEEIFAAFA